jgi:hypothetical protein
MVIGDSSGMKCHQSDKLKRGTGVLYILPRSQRRPISSLMNRCYAEQLRRSGMNLDFKAFSREPRMGVKNLT